MDEGGQVLVAGDVEGETLADGPEGLVATGLRPSVRVVIGDQILQAAAVVGGPAAENRLGEDALQVRPLPVACPVFEERQLPVPISW